MYPKINILIDYTFIGKTGEAKDISHNLKLLLPQLSTVCITLFSNNDQCVHTLKNNFKLIKNICNSLNNDLNIIPKETMLSKRYSRNSNHRI